MMHLAIKYFNTLIGVAFLLFLSSIYLSPAAANQTQLSGQKTSYIAVIIDDLGYRPKNDKRAIMLKGNISYAILPNTPHAQKLAKLAHKNNKEVILHLPMESELGKIQEKNVLTRKMNKQAFIKVLENHLAAVPHISGINNHMGSLLTQSSLHMNWLMSFLAFKTLDSKELFFIDSRTTNKTIAAEVATDYHIPNTHRNVFLDHVHTREAIEGQYQRLIKLANKHGSALAIGHPFTLTLSFLEEKLPELKKLGIKLVSVKELIAIQHKL